MQKITSSQNPLLKELKSLKLKKSREEKQLFFIEGIRFIEEAIDDNVDIDKIFISERLIDLKGGEDLLGKIKNKNYNVFCVSDKLFQEISDTENPQGILATVKYRQLNALDNTLDGHFYIILDALQDPGNMGTIIRTADAAGVSGIIISKGSVDVYNPKVLRSTMGSIFHVPIYFSDNLSNVINKLKLNGTKVYAAHLKGNANYFEEDMRGRSAIIIGNEANGINDEVADIADVLVKIPMPGRAESLNASVAASILMYEVVRQNSKMF